MTRGKVTGGEPANSAKCANSANSDSRFQPPKSAAKCFFQLRSTFILSVTDRFLHSSLAYRFILGFESLSSSLQVSLHFYRLSDHLRPSNAPSKCLPAHLHPLVAITSRAIRSISSSVANGNTYPYQYDVMSTRLTIFSSNLLYPKEDRINNRLMFTCRTCHVGEPATSYCVYQNKLSSQVGDTAGVTQDVGNDPTVCLSGFCLLCGDQIACFVCGSAS